MSRSGYIEDWDDNWALIKWRGQVASAIRGKRGQQLLKDLLVALDEMPKKRLIREELQHDGEVCALGALGRMRNMDLANIDPEDYDAVADAFNIAPQLSREIVYLNDEWSRNETPEQRWARMRNWVAQAIKTPQPSVSE